MDTTDQPIQNPQPETQVSHSHSSKTKLLLIGLGILFVLGMGGAYVMGTRISQPEQNGSNVTPTISQPISTSNTTVDWKTYTNAKYQYTIDYPDFLKHTSVIVNGVTTDKWVSSDNSYAIFVISYPEGVNSYLQFYADTKKDESVSVAGQKVRKLVGKEVVSEKGTLIHIGPLKHIRQNHMLVYSSTSDLANSAGISIFDQMISSFKFTDQAQFLSPTASLLTKSYKDKDYGYSISYPKEWSFRRTYGDDIKKPGIEDIMSGIDIHNDESRLNISIVANVLDSHGMTDIDAWINKYDLNYPKNSSKEKVIFNTYPAIKYVYNSDRGKEAIYFISGKYAYRIYYSEIQSISDITREVVESFRPQ